jgi:hypothetical protein
MSADNTVERAAEVITWRLGHTMIDIRSQPWSPNSMTCAQALADAGLLLTDEMRAVLVAAVEWFEWEAAHAPDGGPHDPRDLGLYQLLSNAETRATVRALRETQP